MGTLPNFVNAVFPLQYNSFKDKFTSITGTAEPGSTVTVKLETTVLGTTITYKNGNFTLTIPAQKPGIRLDITATDDGNISLPTNITVAPVTGRIFENGKWYFSKNGVKITGWILYNNNWFILTIILLL